MTSRIKIFNIENIEEAKGFRMARDKLFHVMREGAMTLPGSIILSLIDLAQSYDESLAKVPSDWPMTHRELAAAGII